jgi:transcriptional regulator with XRE-family HTH domain
MALEKLGDHIRTIRKVRGLSQEALARRADVSLNLVGKLELGIVTNPHYATLAGLARALDVTVEELVKEPPVPLAM